MSTSDMMIRAIVQMLVASGELAVNEEGDIVFAGERMTEVNANPQPDVANQTWDEDGIGTEMTEFGGRRIKVVEEYRETLSEDLRKKIPTYHIVAPPGSVSLRGYLDEFKAQGEKHGWDWDAMRNASKNISRTTFQAMGGDTIGMAFDYLSEEPKRVKDHAPYSVGLNQPEDILAKWKARVEHWQKPNDGPQFSPRPPGGDDSPTPVGDDDFFG